jgi:hypothetical protein
MANYHQTRYDGVQHLLRGPDMLKPRVSDERLEDSLRRLKPLDATSNVMLPKVWLT